MSSQRQKKGPARRPIEDVYPTEDERLLFTRLAARLESHVDQLTNMSSRVKGLVPSEREHKPVPKEPIVSALSSLVETMQLVRDRTRDGLLAEAVAELKEASKLLVLLSDGIAILPNEYSDAKSSLISSVVILKSSVDMALAEASLIEAVTDGRKEEGWLSTPAHIWELQLWLDKIGVPAERRPALVKEIYRLASDALTPKWKYRLSYGLPLASLTAPMFLKTAHSDLIAPDGSVSKEAISERDPDLMKAVDGYISQRKWRGLDRGDAEDLNLVLMRPGAAYSKRTKPRPTT